MYTCDHVYDRGESHRDPPFNPFLLAEFSQKIGRFHVILRRGAHEWSISVRCRGFVVRVISAECLDGCVAATCACEREIVPAGMVKKYCLIAARQLESGKHPRISTSRECGRAIGVALRRVIVGMCPTDLLPQIPPETIFYSQVDRGWATGPVTDIDREIAEAVFETSLPFFSCERGDGREHAPGFEHELDREYARGNRWPISAVTLNSYHITMNIAEVNPVGWYGGEEMYDVSTVAGYHQDCDRADVWELFVEMIVGFSAEMSASLVSELTMMVC